MILACLLLCACNRPDHANDESSSTVNDDVSEHQASFFIFGTQVDLDLRGIDAQSASSHFAQINQDLMSYHRDWHPWEPGELTDLNRLISEGQSMVISQETRKMLSLAKLLARQSDSQFNPAIGGLIRLWGFHTDRYPVQTPPPSATAINDWLSHSPTMEQLFLEGANVSSSNHKLQLDVSGFAKGYAVDRVIDRLKLAEVPAALINAGGDLRAYGQSADAWRIAVRNPVSGDVLAGISINGDEAIFTSGNYIRYKEHDGMRYSHILDPSTGYPVDRIVSATVIANEGSIADAAATALIIAGESGIRPLMHAMSLTHVLLLDAEGCAHLDHQLQQRIEWLPSEPDCIRIH